MRSSGRRGVNNKGDWMSKEGRQPATIGEQGLQGGGFGRSYHDDIVDEFIHGNAGKLAR